MDPQITNFLKILKSAFHDDRSELIEPDWVKLYNFAVHHSVLPIFYEGCNKYIEFLSAPEDIRDKFLSSSLQIIIGQAKRTRDFLIIYEKLKDAGIKPIVLKGLVCRSTYGELKDHRPSGDEDILIQKEEFYKCSTILKESGFLMEDIQITDKLLSEVQHIRFTHSGLCLNIEVHLSFTGNINMFRKKINTYIIEAFDHRISLFIEGHWIDTMNHTAHYLFLFLHYLKHFTSSGAGIRQMLDLFLYERNYHDEIDRVLIENTILKMSAGSLYGDVIGIGKQYLGFAVHTNLSGYNMEVLLTDTMITGVFGNATTEQVLSSRYTGTALTSGKYSLRKLVFPNASTLNIVNPTLLDKPYLLPYIWVKRCIRILLRRGLAGGSLIKRSMKIGKQRIKLLKEYSIL